MKRNLQKTRIMTDTLHEVYDILVDICGADEHWRENFVQVCDADCTEYRFCGKLGFGGKYRCREGNKIRVDYYSEDKTEERDQMVIKANELLDTLFNQ